MITVLLILHPWQELHYAGGTIHLPRVVSSPIRTRRLT